MSTVLILASLCLLVVISSTAYPLDQKNGQIPDDKRSFDPIEVASNFGSFGKRYRYNGPHSQRFNSIMSGILDQLRGVDTGYGGFRKRQFDPIGYGMFARFG